MRGKSSSMDSGQRRSALHGLSFGLHRRASPSPLQKLRQSVLRPLQQQQRSAASVRPCQARTRLQQMFPLPRHTVHSVSTDAGQLKIVLAASVISKRDKLQLEYERRETKGNPSFAHFVRRYCVLQSPRVKLRVAPRTRFYFASLDLRRSRLKTESECFHRRVRTYLPASDPKCSMKMEVKIQRSSRCMRYARVSHLDIGINVCIYISSRSMREIVSVLVVPKRLYTLM